MVDQNKKAAAEAALRFVEPDMRLGLGTGSTAALFVSSLGERVREGLPISAVATSIETERLAHEAGIKMVDFNKMPELDLTVDGADEIDPKLRLIKGGGGALLREKIVASASQRLIVIADESKLVTRLGAFRLPIEIIPFGAEATKSAIFQAAGKVGLSGEIETRQTEGGPFLTDSGNLILDASFGLISDPEGLEAGLCRIPGVVETGLFLSMADLAIVAGPKGISMIRP